MQRTMEYSPQQSQFPSCQKGFNENSSMFMQSEQSHTFSGNNWSKCLHLPQSTSTQFTSTIGQNAFLDSVALTSGTSWYCTSESKKFSRSSRDLEKESSFLGKLFFRVRENILAAFTKCFNSKKDYEDSEAYYHFNRIPRRAAQCLVDGAIDPRSTGCAPRSNIWVPYSSLLGTGPSVLLAAAFLAAALAFLASAFLLPLFAIFKLPG